MNQEEEYRARDQERERQVAIGKEYYQLHRKELERDYMGQFIAIIGNEVFHEFDLGELQVKTFPKLINEDKYAYVTKVGGLPPQMFGTHTPFSCFLFNSFRRH